MDMSYIDELMQEIKNCREELQQAQNEFDVCDEDMVDSCALKIKWLTVKYDTLHKRLCKEVYPKDFFGNVKKQPTTFLGKIKIFFQKNK